MAALLGQARLFAFKLLDEDDMQSFLVMVYEDSIGNQDPEMLKQDVNTMCYQALKKKKCGNHC